MYINAWCCLVFTTYSTKGRRECNSEQVALSYCSVSISCRYLNKQVLRYFDDGKVPAQQEAIFVNRQIQTARLPDCHNSTIDLRLSEQVSRQVGIWSPIPLINPNNDPKAFDLQCSTVFYLNMYSLGPSVNMPVGGKPITVTYIVDHWDSG